MTSILLLLVACGPVEEEHNYASNADPTLVEDTSPNEHDPGSASVSVTAMSPTFEDAGAPEEYLARINEAGGITFSWEALNFAVNPDHLGGGDVQGEGQYAVYWHLQSIESEQDPYVITTDTTVTIPASEVTSSDYFFAVVLMDNSGDLMPISDVESWTILNPLPEFPRLAADMAVDSTTTLTVDTGSFSLDEASVGLAPVFGSGGYGVWVDGVLDGTGATEVYTYTTPLTAGPHTISLELLNNDGTSLVPANITDIAVVVPTVEAVDATGGMPWDSGSLPVSATATDVVIDEASMGTDHVPGIGHFHAYVDDVYQTAFGESGGWVTNLAPGTHTVEIRLADNDHTEVGVADSYEVTVTADRPDVVLTLPTDDEGAPITEFDEGETITLGIAAENFTFDEAAIGGDNVEDVGHYHISVDGEYLDLGTGPTFDLVGLTADGEAAKTYDVMVSLQQNNHDPLTPECMDMVSVTINPAPVEEPDTGDTGDTGA